MTSFISSSKSRKVYLDFLRILSIYIVLFNHTKTRGFAFFTIAEDSPFRFLYLCITIFSKAAVPVFFMISGALLLGREESIRYTFRRRFLKYLCVLIAASLLIYVYKCYRVDHRTFSMLYFLKKLYTRKLASALWYLYTYLAFLLMLPLLRKMAQNIAEKEYFWLFLMYGLMQIVSIIDFLLFKGTAAHSQYFSLFITTSYIIYPFIGYYIDRIMDAQYLSRKILLLLTGLSILSIIISALLTEYSCTLLNEWKEATCQTFFNTLIFIPAGTVFYAAKVWFTRHMPSERICSLITKCGGLTFGIFLIEEICRTETDRIYTILQPVLHTFPTCLIWILAACILGGAITLLAKKIPVVKDYL